MRRARVAIIGDTRLVHGALSNAGAIATELATGWPVDVGIRSVAHAASAWEYLDGEFGKLDITTWLSIRQPEEPDGVAASIRMGDTLNIDELFSHDLVIVACRDVALRRFLADLPVHTYPGVRIISLIHFDEGVIEQERMEDLTRFDVIVGSEADYARITSADPEAHRHPLESMAPFIHATNVRAAISWGRHGEFTCARPDQPLLSVAALHAPHTPSDAPWAAFTCAIAMGMINRQSWEDIGRDAARQFARRTQGQRRPEG
jgi:hypothetical protein